MRLRSALAALCLMLPIVGGGCHPAEVRSAGPAIAMLDSADWTARRKAADSLAQGEGPPTEAVRPLYAALRREQNPKAYGAMLIALGASGIAEARPLIDARVNDPDGDMQQWARAALKRWLVRNSLMGEEDALPPPPHRLYGPSSPPPGAPGAQPTPGLDTGP
jgi:hypothetical protein